MKTLFSLALVGLCVSLTVAAPADLSDKNLEGAIVNSLLQYYTRTGEKAVEQKAQGDEDTGSDDDLVTIMASILLQDMQGTDQTVSEGMTDALLQAAMMQEDGDDGDKALMMGFFRRLRRRIGGFIRRRPGLVRTGLRLLG